MTRHHLQARGGYLQRILSLWESDEDAEALVGGEVRLSRAEARSQLLRLAQALRRQGLVPGDGVGLFLGNRVESVLVQPAVHLIGCRIVFLPPEPGAGELAGLIDQSEVRVVVADPAFAEQASDAVGRCASPPALLSLGPGVPGADADLQSLAADCPALRPEDVPEPGPRDALTVLYTGGTLGHPKPVAHGRLLYDVMAAGAAAACATRPPGSDRVLAATLLTHGSGHLTMLYALLTGSTLVVLPEWDAEALLATLREEEITVTALVPPMLYQLLDHPACSPGALPLLRQITIGAAPVSPARLREAVETFGRIISQGYGQTECLGITSMPPEALPPTDDPGSPLWSSCGDPLPGTELEIRGEDGSLLPRGETGEVCVRSPAMMLGYYRDEERTGRAVRDGLLYTGDIGRLDGEGRLYLVDRKKDVIVTGRTSDNVYIRVLEDYLLTLPGIRHAAAVGVPDEEFGEAVRIFLAPEEGIDAQAVGASVTAVLGELYTPRDTVLLPSLPMTPVGKVDKQALRAHEPSASRA